MDDWGAGRGRIARGWAIGLLAAATVMLVAASAAAAAPFVSVEAKLKRLLGGGAVVTGRIVWDESAAGTQHRMSVGDLRLVAVSDHGHLPTLLNPDTPAYNIALDGATQRVHLVIKPELLHAIRRGNRVVLTASQHRPVSVGTRTDRTYVTVGELQPFGTPQGRIGRRDCSEVPIVPRADLNRCDLVGAYLDRALVSVPKQRRDERSTRMLLADLTGATMRGADLTGLSVAGGRLNGADASQYASQPTVLENLSLAGAEATGMNARGATSGTGGEGANLFDARLTGADFSGAVLLAVSLDHSRFDGANFSGATLTGHADGVSFRGANLEGLNGSGATVYFADFTDTDLRGSPFQKSALEWATLCHTTVPAGFPTGAGDRDCRARTDPGPMPVSNPFVVIDNASFRRLLGHPHPVEIRATIRWNPDGINPKLFGMSVGDVRVVAIDGSTGLPTTIDSRSAELSPTTTTTIYRHTVTDRVKLAALSRGNRVVLTATQHPPPPRTAKTNRSYVTVHTLQSGPGRGRVGMRDCSNIPLNAAPPALDQYNFCDLPGAALRQAQLAGSMRKADLTGAELGDAGLNDMVFDGAAMGGVVATGADFKSVHMEDAFAPRLTMPGPGTLIDAAFAPGARLDNANFRGATLIEVHLPAASLRGAKFSDAKFFGVDLGFARLQKAKLKRVEAPPPPPAGEKPFRPTSLFLANLTDANLEDSHWANNEADEPPFRWATLCDTIMPAGINIDGNRDCPR